MAAQARFPEIEIAGKTCLVTGANTGIGRSTALGLAARGASVVLACRNVPKAEAVAKDLRETTGNKEIFVHPLDLSSVAATRQSAERYLESGRPLDILINNAGLAGQRGLTTDGFELAFGTNHLGHFLFTLLVLDLLRASPGARVVVVASNNHRYPKAIDYQRVREPTRTVTGLREYGVSKLANVLFASELSRRLAPDAVATYSLNPGRIASDIWKRVPWPIRPLFMRTMKTNEEGAQTSLMCACSRDLATHSGRYYNQCVEETPSKAARDQALATELWTRSCEFVGMADPLPADRAQGSATYDRS